MKIKTLFYLTAIILFILTDNLLTQNISHLMKTSSIELNGKKQNIADLSNLVLATTDSITFEYICINSDNQKVGFFYRITIKNNDQSSTYTTNNTIIRYKSLPEGDYKLTILAFDPRNKWESDTLFIKFLVNNHEMGLINQISNLREKLQNSGTYITHKPESKKLFNLNYQSVGLGLFTGFAIFAIIFFVFKNVNKKSNFVPAKIVEELVRVGDSLEFKKVQDENTRLSNEVNILRTQITNLSTRTNELSHQNHELKIQIEKLSKNQEEIQNLQQQKDDLFAVVIHDIKNPASLIKSLIDLLRSYDLNATETSEIIDNIYQTSLKIVSLSQEVTKILALESKSLILNLDEAPMNEIVSDVFKRNSIAAHTKEIELLIELSPDLPDIKMDAQKIDEVVDNLISNAIKFSYRGGKVKVATKRNEDSVLVEISDNGLGLSQDDITKAFQRGTKLSAQPTAGEPSSGFGLWVVKKLVESHKGKVWVKSKLGMGSTFSFSIPINMEDVNV